MHYAVRRFIIVALAATMIPTLVIYHRNLEAGYHTVTETITVKAGDLVQVVSGGDGGGTDSTASTSGTDGTDGTYGTHDTGSKSDKNASTKPTYAWQYSAQNPPPEPADDYIAMCLAVKNQTIDLPEWLHHHYYHMGIGRFFIMDDGSIPPLEEQLTNLTIPREKVEFHYYPPEKHEEYMQYRVYGDCIKIIRERIKEAEKAKEAAEKADAAAGIEAREENKDKKPDNKDDKPKAENKDGKAKAATGKNEKNENSKTDKASTKDGTKATKTSAATLSTTSVISANYTPPTWMAFFDADEFLDAVGELTMRQQLEIYEPIQAIGGIGINWRIHTSDGNLQRQPSVLGAFFSCISDEDDHEGMGSNNRHVKSIVRVAAFERAFDPHSFVLRNHAFTVGELGDVIVGDDENLIKGFLGSARRHPITRQRFALHHYATKSRSEWEEKMHRGSAMSNHKGWDWWDKMENGTDHEECREMLRWARPPADVRQR